MDLSCIEVPMVQNWSRHCLARRSPILSCSYAGFCDTVACQCGLQLLQWPLTSVFFSCLLWCGFASVPSCCAATYDILSLIGLLDMLLWLSMDLVGCSGIPLYVMPSESTAINWILLTTVLQMWIICLTLLLIGNIITLYSSPSTWYQDTISIVRSHFLMLLFSICFAVTIATCVFTWTCCYPGHLDICLMLGHMPSLIFIESQHINIT